MQVPQRLVQPGLPERVLLLVRTLIAKMLLPGKYSNI
jgi:hypothetical protein